MDRRLGAWAGDVEAGGGARTGRWGLGRLAIGLGMGWWNRTAVRELAGELRDEGGRRAREKKKKLTGELERKKN